MELEDLSKLPGDVLFYVLRFLDLRDSIAFSLVCSTTHALSQKRTFWITALQNARLTRPIACTFHEDLTKHDLQSLKRIALHTLRLERNWSLVEPQIIGPVKAVKLGVPALDVIFQVPGTELYLLHSRVTGMVACWDIGQAKAVTTPIYVARRILDVSPGQDERGKFSMGLLASDGEEPTLHNILVVVCIQYDQPEVTVKAVLQHTFEPFMYHWAVFMTKEIVGVIRCDSEITNIDASIELIVFNNTTGRKTIIATDILREGFPFAGQSGTSTLNGDVFILVEHKNESYVYHCPRKYLPTDDNRSCPTSSSLRCMEDRAATIWSQGDADRLETEGALSADPYYGVPGVSLHRFVFLEDGTNHVEMSTMQIRFWTGPTVGNDGRPVRPHLKATHHVNLTGTLQDSLDSSWQLMLLPHSGRKVLLVLNVQGRVYLHLISFDRETCSSTVHLLNIPPFIDISFIYGLSLDDHRGVVSLLDSNGWLYAIPYA
ncbi:hypothetical protein B0H34DRAFT_700475 [Crassisporium funariophilum]|nr:hypothetical protein B0H34DRAFT_700475 [Crassisporium funariophilum]